MKIFKRAQDLIKYVQPLNSSVGFVPTMGALHRGHASLIEIALRHSDIVVCSIFVNPTQFNNLTDLEKYPRQTENDIELLLALGVDVLYLPEVEDVYPEGLDSALLLELNGMDTVMEGAFRPGHFSGVLQVVNRLLDIVRPRHLYMGQKDFQQFMLIDKMIKQLKLPVELRVCKIVRAEDGLALSSRNALLTSDQKQQATIIYQTLQYAKSVYGKKEEAEIRVHSMEMMKEAGLRPEYFEIVAIETLRPDSNNVAKVACTAAYVGEVRLIDNAILTNVDEPIADFFVP